MAAITDNIHVSAIQIHSRNKTSFREILFHFEYFIFNRCGESKMNSKSETVLAMRFYDPPEQQNAKMYKCKICGMLRNGNKPSNLVSHLKSCHSTTYTAQISRKNVNSTKKLEIKRLMLLQQCVEITTINKQPFNDLLKSGFQKMIANKLQKFEQNGMKLDLQSSHLSVVKDHIQYTAARIREKIQAEINNKMISLSADVVTKNLRSIFGVIAQYIMNGSTVFRSIGMKEMHDRHSGRYMSELLKECLEHHGASFQNIASLTTDNASNMKTLLSSLNEELQNEEEVGVYGEDTIQYTEEQEDDDASIIDLTNDAEFEEVINSDTNELEALLSSLEPAEDDWIITNSDEDYVNTIRQSVPDSFLFVNGVNCAAHTLQLGVRDGLARLPNDLQNVISLCREFSKFTRLQKTIYDLEKMGLQKKFPPLDVCTRWSSTYMMVNTYLICS